MKNFDYGKTYYKITNSKENHYGLQYHDGLVEDINKFREDILYHNGIYFNTIENILLHTTIKDSRYIREVTIPEDALVCKELNLFDLEFMYKANKVILGKRYDIFNKEDMEYLVSIGMNIHVNNNTPLNFACYSGRLDIVKSLVELGIDIHIENESALRYACNNGHLNVVKYLVEQGADIHVENERVLCSTCIIGSLDVVKYLVEQGADIHADDDFPFIHACSNGRLDIVKYLVEKGIDIHHDNINELVLYYASVNGHQHIIDYIKSLS